MRDRILAAAVSVMRDRGVTNTTTKEIARAAGVAEGSIYNHFANKTELVAACMAEVAGGIREALVRLTWRVGEGTVDDNLTELAEAEIAFFTDLLPITGPVLGDPDLREWLRHVGPHQDTGQEPSGDTAPTSGESAGAGARADRHQAALDGVRPEAGEQVAAVSTARPGGGASPGPALGHAALIGYLEAEQRAGRLAPYARPPYLAATLLGACQQYAFVRLLTPPETMSQMAGLPADPAEYAREIVRTVMMGHHPRRARPR
jgi:AcrR family transcriptional regulator